MCVCFPCMCVFMCMHNSVCTRACVRIREGIDGVLSLFQHGDNRSLTVREREWQLLYQSCWLISVCVRERTCTCESVQRLEMESKINQCHVCPYSNSCVTSHPVVIPKVRWSHVNSHITNMHTYDLLACTSRQMPCVCHPSLSAGTSPRRAELTKCLLAQKSSSFIHK